MNQPTTNTENLKDAYRKVNLIGANSIGDVLDQGGGNWTAYPDSMMTTSGVDFPEHRGIVRDDNKFGLGVVKGRFEIINNPEAFTFFDTIVQDRQAEYKSYAEIDGGRKVIITAKTPKIADVRKGDPIQSEIKLINSFDGSTSFQVIFSVLRLVCTNGMTRKSKESVISIRHTKNKDARMQDAYKILMGANASWEIFLTECRTLAQKALDAQMVNQFISDLTAIKDEKPSQLNGKPISQFNPVENYFTTLLGLNLNNLSTNKYNSACDIANLTFTGKGNNGSSVWDLYSGTTEYYDHYRGTNPNKREKSSIIGSGATLKEKALDLALAF